ncbi:hypothetical protein CGMCC3_g6101 [Colletotrichum fructicola]|uniref:Uncharacterized protein n=1 Tax=Colletotrichum fructicola (strain Nara gc5) TaxID=1213859 RepID=A0A7J6IFW5_COLFN|nr:uncharacterized protein CGMCC3_g6101 [Colletotrichum fructicola]KAE9577631.1 hypothetical protein CGMCC3_g6101 [Colletotrichum fructicola]KAF4419628.1 hypothetical protein CFRS1_v005548 [Colletotrichum fructicola]KAF4474825.1 hypothetical protein CGGC5_v015793 [Colletotrichum fructicola Nara gc5]KAF4884926.1 hypothetical protein CGCFRS4_v012349 [Colletotrichum fructicola]
MHAQLREFLFHVQTSNDFAVLFFATQGDKYDWIPIVTLSGFILWILTSFLLTLEYKEYLVESAPWTIIAVLGPVSAWSTIVTTKEIDFYYAGLFTPAWIGVGLIILAVYDSRKCLDRLDGAGKGQVDIERGIRRQDSHENETGGTPTNLNPQVPKTNHHSSTESSRTPPISHTVSGIGRTTTR